MEHNIMKDAVAKSKIITRDGHTPTPQVEVGGRIIFDYTTEEALVEEIKELMKKWFYQERSYYLNITIYLKANVWGEVSILRQDPVFSPIFLKKSYIERENYLNEPYF